MSDRIKQITHELREYGYDSAGYEGEFDRATALEAADLLESIKRETEPVPLTPNRLIVMDGKLLYLVDSFPQHKDKYTGWVVLRVKASDNPNADPSFRMFEIWSDKIPREQIGDTKHGIVSCMTLYATEPKGDAT